MNLLFSLDLVLWIYVIPVIKQEYFKSKIISITSILYISVFPLARKFIRHYLTGKGKSLSVSTKETILQNPAVYDTIKREINSYSTFTFSSSMQIGQHLVYHPEYRYSLGSFDLKYETEGNQLSLKIITNYNFDRENDRLTRYLHQWLFSLEASGRARSFDIDGEEWRTSMDEFSSLNPGNKMRKYMDLNILYV